MKILCFFYSEIKRKEKFKINGGQFEIRPQRTQQSSDRNLTEELKQKQKKKTPTEILCGNRLWWKNLGNIFRKEVFVKKTYGKLNCVCSGFSLLKLLY